jgi:hypothetical protein
MASKTDPSLQTTDIPLIKGMLARGDRQSDIAAFFGVNSGRIAEIHTGKRFPEASTAIDGLPPPGPYLAARSAHQAKDTLVALRDLIEESLQQIEIWEQARDE